MRGLWRRVRAWWSRRTLRFRVGVVAAVGALVCLTLLTNAAAFLVWRLVLTSVDADLHPVLDSATRAVAEGRPLPPVDGNSEVRVLDTGGTAVDGGPPPRMYPWELDRLRAGEGTLHVDHDGRGMRRWLGAVVGTPDGTQRLVVAGADLVGYQRLIQHGGGWLRVGTLLGAVAVGAATWLTVRWSLRPVERMRAAAGALPPGRRLPVPEARDELRALAEELNALLARRDEATERLRRFTGDAAHELRSPVASIRAQAEVAVAHPDPETAQEVLADIAVEAERLSRLVDDLLALARADAGEPPTAVPVELGPAVAEAVRRARAAADDSGRPVFSTAVPAPVSVLATPGEVALVLDNLLSNAARYARSAVRVSAVPAGRLVRLVVDDDGPGVPEAHWHRVFDRFHRVEDDRGRATGGAGLGLALVAETVRRRGGSVRMERSPEGGARVEVHWPAAAAEAEAETAGPGVREHGR